ncbi:MAG: DUF2783 domain-containing protein [Roseibium sp.]|uniref:DUF2783 domain-containing protein n=2 Tax=Pseudomonadota TaxID=1224 RepID=UPI003297431D
MRKVPGKMTENIGFTHPDDFYAQLLAAHDGLSKAESDALNARLILVLAAFVGDQDKLTEALELAARKE